jgi:hypothetical protein
LKPEIWDQLKNKTADDFINALKRDGRNFAVVPVDPAEYI